MIKAQKVIKYCAIAFAVALIFSIISGIMSLIYTFGNNTNHLEEGKATFEEIKYLDIEVKNVNLVIQEGNELTVETNNKNVSYKKTKYKLVIEEEKHSWFNNDGSYIVISIPKDYMFEEVEIETGAGAITIRELSTKTLDLDLGAGKVEVNNLMVSSNTSIDSGAGSLIINDSNLNNLKFDMGVGNTTINSSVTGRSEISAGVGRLELNLTGNDYKIRVDKGLGTATINGDSVGDNTYYGTGSNLIEIDGGVGKIVINCPQN